jgi:hypothetical protein
VVAYFLVLVYSVNNVNTVNLICKSFFVVVKKIWYKEVMELIGVRVSKEIKDKLQAIADEEQRPLSNLVRIIITDWLKGREAQETKKKPRKKP